MDTLWTPVDTRDGMGCLRPLSGPYREGLRDVELLIRPVGVLGSVHRRISTFRPDAGTRGELTEPLMTRVMPLMFRLGLLPKPPIASTVATLDDRTSKVIRPVVEPQISSGGRELKRYLDVEFARPSSRGGRAMNLRMDILVPASGPPAPAVVYVGGGGFIMAPKEAALPRRTYVAEAGLVVASIQYRTVRNGATYRDGVADVKSAVRFLRAQAATYGIDPHRMAIWGESAGGYLAAMAALTTGNSDFEAGENLGQSSSVQAVVDQFGASDLSKVGDDFDATTRAQLLSGGNLRRYIGAKDGALDPSVASSVANPLTYVTPSAPPFLILHGSQDRLISPSQTLLLHERLRAAGVPTTRYVLEGANHGDLSFLGDRTSGLVWSSKETMDLIVDFLSTTIGVRPQDDS